MTVAVAVPERLARWFRAARAAWIAFRAVLALPPGKVQVRYTRCAGDTQVTARWASIVPGHPAHGMIDVWGALPERDLRAAIAGTFLAAEWKTVETWESP